MKNISLSADGEISVFSVPNKVADNFEKYCLEFYSDWLYHCPEAAEYRIKKDDVIGVCYDEKDFIDYLNHVCSEKSSLVITLSGVYAGDELPEQYAGLPYFNF